MISSRIEFDWIFSISSIQQQQSSENRIRKRNSKKLKWNQMKWNNWCAYIYCYDLYCCCYYYCHYDAIKFACLKRNMYSINSTYYISRNAFKVFLSLCLSPSHAHCPTKLGSSRWYFCSLCWTDFSLPRKIATAPESNLTLQFDINHWQFNKLHCTKMYLHSCAIVISYVDCRCISLHLINTKYGLIWISMLLLLGCEAEKVSNLTQAKTTR